MTLRIFHSQRTSFFTLLACLWLFPLPAQIAFTEIPGLPFLDDESFFRGISWIDVDGDHDLDVCVTGAGGTFPDFVNKSAIFINDGAGNFTNTGLLESDQDNPMGHGWADYDNDGDPDLYIGATWNSGGTNELWINENGANFTLSLVSGSTPPIASPYEGSVSWTDYDNDGFADLFLPRWNDQSDKLYHNNGDGTFTEVFGMEPVTEGAWTSAGTWGDYDHDGDPDLFVANYQFNSNGPGVNRLYENNGDGTFSQVSGAGEIVTDGQGTRAANWIDANNDGWLDLFAANQGNPTTGSDGLDKLYINNGDGTFSTQIIGSDLTSWTSNWGDYDNDGDLDLITISLWGDDAKMWQNDGTANFTDVSAETPSVFPLETSGSWANAAIFVDYDQDGWLDLHISQADAAPDRFLRNEGEDCRSWLELDLTGLISNGLAIGAKVFAKATVNGQPLWQMREVSAQNSKPGQNPLRQHFGFADAGLIDSLLIAWPAGDTCVFTNLAANQILRIDESCSTETIVAPPALTGSTTQLELCSTIGDTLLTPPSGPGGNWSADCGTCIDQSGLFQSGSLDNGTYTLLYNLGGVCGSTDTLLITLQNAGAGTDANVTFCLNTESIDLLPELGGNPEPGGQWFDPTGSPVTMPTDLLAGDFIYVQQSGSCADTAVLNVAIAALPSPFTEVYAIAPGDTLELDGGPGQTYIWEPATDLSCNDCRNPVFSGESEGTYTVTVENEAGCLVTHTIEIVFDLSAAYDIPTAFSPNGDGTNDEFRVLAEEGTFSSFNLRVYNRWGQLIFETTDPGEGWNGLTDEEPQPADTYVFQFSFQLIDGSEGEEAGELTLLR